MGHRAPAGRGGLVSSAGRGNAGSKAPERHGRIENGPRRVEMQAKVIKKGTARAERAQRFRFGATRAEPSAEMPALPDWMKQARPRPALPPADSPQPAIPEAETVVPMPQAIDLEAAEQAAYQRGFHEGERTGLAAAEKMAEAGMRRYADALLEIARLRSTLYRRVEHEVVKLALECAKKIVQHELKTDPELIQNLVRAALGNIAERSAVTILLHPVDCKYLMDHRNELSPEGEGTREILFLADKTIERGGCLIRTECGDVDARIEEQFRELEHGLLEGRKSDAA